MKYLPFELWPAPDRFAWEELLREGDVLDGAVPGLTGPRPPAARTHIITEHGSAGSMRKEFWQRLSSIPPTGSLRSASGPMQKIC